MSADFAERLLDWFDREGRHDLPWQQPRTPYRVWLAEVMLQQTQVATVIPYFQRFVARWDSFAALASAPLDEVLVEWAGLGYYARARHLHAAARTIVERHGSRMPQDFESVAALPGVGRSTAGAILAQAYGQRHAILDGNVKRVLSRHLALSGWPGESAVAAQLWSTAEARTPQNRIADYTQAIMDLGATVCTTRAPACARCPIATDCGANARRQPTAFPASKPKRARPLRRGRLLLVRDPTGAILLERRPAPGIWGGLWSPPWLSADDPPAVEVLADRYGLDAIENGAGIAFRHGFTHFELELTPVHLQLRSPAIAIITQSPLRWLTIGTQPLPALPAPIARVLAGLDPNDSSCPASSTASSSAGRPKGSTAHRSPAPSARASSNRSPNRPGANGSRTRRA